VCSGVARFFGARSYLSQWLLLTEITDVKKSQLFIKFPYIWLHNWTTTEQPWSADLIFEIIIFVLPPPSTLLPNFSLREWQLNETKVTEEYCWAITQARGGGGGTVMLGPIRFHCVGVLISTGFYFIYIYIWPMYTQIPTCAKFDLGRTFSQKVATA
jgi:hypothetical protein